MKVLQAGNLANFAYQVARQLRKDNVDSDLLLDLDGGDPSLLDPSLKNNYPEWFIFYDRKKSSWKTNILKIMRNKKYDLIHAYTELAIFAYLSRRKFIANTQGSDLRQIAFQNSLRGILMRRAYRKAKLVILSQPDHIPLIKKLKIKNVIYLPNIFDVDYYSPKNVEKEQSSKKFTILHPTTLFWKGKGNDIIVKGFAKFVKKNPDSILIIIDKNRIDSQRTKILVEDLGISEKVQFVNGPLNRLELEEYYNKSDVVIDQVKNGSMGAIALETMLCEKPLIVYIKEDEFKKVFPRLPPVFNVKSDDDISNQLEKLLDSELRRIRGKEGRQWVIENHSGEVISKKLQLIYELVLDGKDISKIREAISQSPFV